jgi:hypothetical protein
VPRAQRGTRINNPGTVNINLQPETPPTIPADDAASKKNFWEEQEILNTAEGKNYVIYLYRLQPGTLGHKGYIAKFSQPVTVEEIKETFGGYEYRISLHKGVKWICGDVFSISAPPKAIGTADPAMFAGMMPHPNTSGETTSQMTHMLAFINERLDKERREKASDPAYVASLELVRESAKQAITAAYAQTRNPAAETMQNQMMTMMMNQMGQVTAALLARSLERPERGSVSGIKELLDILPLLGVKLGTGGGRGIDPMAALGQTLINSAPNILDAAAGFMEKYRLIATERTRQAELQFNAVAVSRGQPPVTVSVREVPGAPAPPRPAPAPARADGFSVAPFPEVNLGPAAPAAPAFAPVTDFDGDLVKRRIVELIHRGMSGDALMAFISGVNETFAQTMKTCTEAQIRGFFAGDPILAQALSSSNFDQCLAEAIEYLHPEPEPPPVTH